MKMTLEEAKEEFESIRDISFDPETAHEYEDGFRESVLLNLLMGNIKEDEKEAIIKLALDTSEIEFPRWCA